MNLRKRMNPGWKVHHEESSTLSLDNKLFSVAISPEAGVPFTWNIFSAGGHAIDAFIPAIYRTLFAAL